MKDVSGLHQERRYLGWLCASGGSKCTLSLISGLQLTECVQMRETPKEWQSDLRLLIYGEDLRITRNQLGCQIGMWCLTPILWNSHHLGARHHIDIWQNTKSPSKWGLLIQKVCTLKQTLLVLRVQFSVYKMWICITCQGASYFLFILKIESD